MDDQHRVTPHQWLAIENMTRDNNLPVQSTILELRDRVEALEAQHEDDKEAWGAMRRSNSTNATRINALMRRIEILERDRRAILDSSSRLRVGLDAAQPPQVNHPAKPDSSLVERVAAAITGDGDEPINWKPEARAAIRAVAKWLREENPLLGGNSSAFASLLERENN